MNQKIIINNDEGLSQINPSMIARRLRELFKQARVDLNEGLQQDIKQRSELLITSLSLLDPTSPSDVLLASAIENICLLDNKGGKRLILKSLDGLVDGYFEIVIGIIAAHQMNLSDIEKWISVNLKMFPNRDDQLLN